MFIPTRVSISQLKIGTPDHNSVVSLGSNFMVGMNVAGKKNQGYGQQKADELVLVNPVHIVFDDEMIDMPTIKK